MRSWSGPAPPARPPPSCWPGGALGHRPRPRAFAAGEDLRRVPEPRGSPRSRSPGCAQDRHRRGRADAGGDADHRAGRARARRALSPIRRLAPAPSGRPGRAEGPAGCCALRAIARPPRRFPRRRSRDGCDRGGTAPRDGSRGRRHPGRRHELRAAITIGADGRASVIAQRLGCRRPHRLRRLALVTYVRGVPDCREVGEIFVDPPDYAILNPVAPDRVNLSLVVPLAHAAPYRARLETFLEARARQLPHLARRIAGAERIAPVQAMGPLAYRVTRRAMTAYSSSATRPASTIHSRGRASSAPCAARSWRRRPPSARSPPATCRRAHSAPTAGLAATCSGPRNG